ncbi:MAG: GreA/GreB family elongation factor [Tepidiformaceae bacterium]
MSDEPRLAAAQFSLNDALQQYLDSLKPGHRDACALYVQRYVDRNDGKKTTVNSLSGSKVESYAVEYIRLSDPQAPEQVAALKHWFAFLKKKEYTPQNFGVHIRLRRAPGRSPGASQVRLEEVPLEMTAEGLEALQRELAEAIGREPELVQAVALAREDKDFRENAPLDAARESLAFHQQRRKQLEVTLKHAVVVGASSGDRAVVGSLVTVLRLDNEKRVTYTLVGANEANATEMRISVDSPVGKQLLGCRANDHVQVTAPSGAIDYRIEAVHQP